MQLVHRSGRATTNNIMDLPCVIEGEPNSANQVEMETQAQ